MDILLRNDITLLCGAACIALPVLILIMIIGKMYKKFAYCMLTAALLVTVGLSAVTGAIMQSSQETSVSEDEEDSVEYTALKYSSPKEYRSAFSGFVLAREYDAAEQIIKECATVHGYSDQCSLMSAQLAYAKKDYSKSLAIYTKLYGEKLPEEAQIAQKLLKYEQNDGPIAESLKANGITQGLTDSEITEARALLAGEAEQALINTLSSSSGADTYKAAAEITAEIESLWTKATEQGADVSEALKQTLDKIKAADKGSSLYRIGVWRVARMKAYLLGGDYSKFVSSLSGYATCEEYTVALDLYLNKKISGSSLKKSFNIKDIEGTDKVLSQLEQVLKDAELTDEQEEQIDSQITRIAQNSRNALFYHMENELLKHANNRDNLRQSSKIYFALADYSGTLNRTSARNEYFSEALTAAANSDDAAYAEAMGGLAEAITGSGSYEAVKDVGKWADQAVANSSYVKGTESMVRDPEKTSQIQEAVQDYTIKASAAISINSIDTSKFNQITATIQVSDEFMSERELKNLLKLYDCSIDIESFTVEKVKYEKANIILCCDNSGSMSGSVNSLKNAVNKFIETATKDESLGFYTFDSRIIQSLPLGSDINAIKAAVDKMGAYGGTAILGTLNNVLTAVETDLNANNILIVMTDGQDGSPSSLAESVSNLAFAKGYVIYVMGMGSGVSVGKLQSIAESSGGQFLFSPTDAQLESLYAFIHGQVKNKYTVTYKTVDTLTVSDRTLQIEIKDQNVSDTRYYNLSEKDEETAILPFDANVSVTGLETRHIVKQKDITNINVKGTGFKSTDSMYIKLSGPRDFNLRATYTDETTFKISVPASIPLGLYDMEVRLNSRYAIYTEELTVSDGTVDEIKFGGYTFTAAKIEASESSTKMSGNVQLNGWLTFNGAVELVGSLENQSVVLYDLSGSRIDYSQASGASGVAKHLKDRSVPLAIPAIGSIRLYNAPSSSSDYPTDNHTLPVLKLLDFFRVDTPEFRLYPDKITVELKKGSSTLPFQDFFVSDTGNTSPFSLSFNTTGTITQNNISMKGEASLNYGYADEILVKFLDCSAAMKKTVGGVTFDTAAGSFGIECNIKIPVFPVDTYIGFGMQWVNMGLDGIQLHYDRDYTKMFGPVPITFSDFSLGFIGMNQKTLNASNETVSKLTLEGKMQISAAKISGIVPKLKKYVGDVSLLSIPEATFRCGLTRFSVEAEAKLVLLNTVELLEAKIALGNYEFSNPLIYLSDEHVVGVYVGLKRGFSWDAHNLKVSLTGKGEFAINNRFIGAAYEGSSDLELNWWIFEKSFHERGNALVGFYTDHSNNTQFTIRASFNQDNGKRKGAIFYITDDGDMDYDLSYKF